MVALANPHCFTGTTLLGVSTAVSHKFYSTRISQPSKKPSKKASRGGSKSRDWRAVNALRTEIFCKQRCAEARSGPFVAAHLSPFQEL